MNTVRGESTRPIGNVRRHVAAAVLLLAGALACVSGASAQTTIPEWARDRTQRWYEAFNAGDAKAIITLYAPDAVLALGGQAYNGLAAIEAFHTANFKSARYSCTWTIGGVAVADTVAAVFGTDVCVETPRAGGEPQTRTGRWLSVYQQQRDGSWLIVRDSGEDLRAAP